jgi:hypothetical protein
MSNLWREMGNNMSSGLLNYLLQAPGFIQRIKFELCRAHNEDPS